MYLKFVEWLYNRELYSTTGDHLPIPRVGEQVALPGNKLYKVVLVTHTFASVSSVIKSPGYYNGATVEIEAITPITPDHPPPLDWGKETK